MEEHRKLYEEDLVREIMLTTAFCVRDLLEDNGQLGEEALARFIEDNYGNLIEEALAGIQEEDPEAEAGGEAPGAAPGGEDR